MQVGTASAVVRRMIENVLEQSLWIGAIAAGGNAVELDGDLDELAKEMLRRFRPRARA